MPSFSISAQRYNFFLNYARKKKKIYILILQRLNLRAKEALPIFTFRHLEQKKEKSQA